MYNYHKYLNVGPLEEKWGFYINTVGYHKVDPAQSYPPVQEHPSDHSFTWNKGRILDGYYLIFIAKGQGVFESARTQPRNVEAGTCFFLFPDIWHRYKPHADSGWEEYWIGFRGAYPEKLMNQGFFLPDKPFVQVGLNENLLALLHKLLETVKTGATGYHQVITGITLQILALVNTISMFEKQDLNPTAKLIAKARFLLQESLEKPVDMEALVKELPMGYSRFRKAFKELTGQSPNQYHLNLRLSKAKDLLINTNLSINEISFKTGFESVFYFSKLFKKKNQVSPKFYRQQE
jgi:AraC-like DNA-binding protein